MTTMSKPEQTTAQAGSITKAIAKAEPTLAVLLRTLDADYVKVQVRCLNLIDIIMRSRTK